MYRAAVILLLSAMTGVAGWWTYNNQEAVRTAVELTKTRAVVETLRVDLGESEALVAERDEEIQELQVRLSLLKVDHRVARIEVVDQEPSKSNPESVVTTVRFIEFDHDGNPVGAEQEISIEGSRLYLETLVIKFDDDYVEAGEFLRGTSLCLFNRIFSERVAPVDGVKIDQPGTHPGPYNDGDGTDALFRAELWSKFWDYANDPEAAAAKGVRAIHGEAPFIEMREGKSYKIELRASGGLSIQAE
ncbi:MAG: hypothetical protein ACI9F9_002437 [Candidatus Paceibacteria bacterium]|jgi:hypothetical protein